MTGRNQINEITTGRGVIYPLCTLEHDTAVDEAACRWLVEPLPSRLWRGDCFYERWLLESGFIESLPKLMKQEK